jgi:hypothetical protein
MLLNKLSCVLNGDGEYGLLGHGYTKIYFVFKEKENQPND